MKGIELCVNCEQQHSFRPCPFLKTGGVRKWKLFQQEGQSIKLLIRYLQNDSDKIRLNDLACLSGKACSHSQFIHFGGMNSLRILTTWHWDKITLVRGNPRLQDLCLMHRKVHEQLSEVIQRNAFELTNCVRFKTFAEVNICQCYEPTAIHSFLMTSQPYGNAHLEGKTRLSSAASQFVLRANVLRQWY